MAVVNEIGQTSNNANKVRSATSGAKPLWKWSYLIYLAVQWLIVALVYHLLSSNGFVVSSAVYWLVAGMGMLAIALMTLGMLKKNISYIWWEALLIGFVFCGIWMLCLSVLPVWSAVIVAGLATLLPYLSPRVLLHDFSFLIGTIGMGLFIAIRFPFSVLLIGSIGVVIYEYLRQNQIQMATLISEAYKVGLPPGILLPASMSGWFKSIDEVWKAGEGMIVGLLPLILLPAISLRVLHYGWPIFVAMFAMITLSGAVWGQDSKLHLRSWFFLAIAVAFYALTGLVNL